MEGRWAGSSTRFLAACPWAPGEPLWAQAGRGGEQTPSRHAWAALLDKVGLEGSHETNGGRTPLRPSPAGWAGQASWVRVWFTMYETGEKGSLLRAADAGHGGTQVPFLYVEIPGAPVGCHQCFIEQNPGPVSLVDLLCFPSYPGVCLDLGCAPAIPGASAEVGVRRGPGFLSHLTAVGGSLLPFRR